ncbi:MAG TPA: hypothetical protein VK196_06135 [Magnetospirillum sp.]|nr:hypothetical protein [Magnetospirillum sp.]
MAAVARLCQLLGIDPPDGADTDTAPIRAAAPALPQRPVDPNRYAGDVRLIRSKCAPAQGVTLVEQYWTSRGIPMPDTPDLQFCDDTTDHANTIGRPAMIGVVRYPDGTETGGVHRTFLNEDGTKEKKMIGLCKGGVVMLAPVGADGRLAISEGIESGAAAMWLHGEPTWATLSTTGMVKFDASRVPGLKFLTILPTLVKLALKRLIPPQTQP